MKQLTEQFLEQLSDVRGAFDGAFSVREDGACAGRRSTAHIRIEDKPDAPGLVIHVASEAQGETVYIPACVTHGGIDDLVYNDFYIAAGADVVIVAGCGVHSEEDTEARHNGIHRFFVGEGAHVVYREKHLGTGAGRGTRRIDPVSEITLAADAELEMDTVQLGGVDRTERKTTARLGDRAKLTVRERIMTDGDETAHTAFEVTLDGEDSGAELLSRSVARGRSRQEFDSCIRGRNRCTGHSSCDAILADEGFVGASPRLEAAHVDAALIHEAAIGKIAGEQLLKLRTLGLTEEEAEERILEGFLK